MPLTDSPRQRLVHHLCPHGGSHGPPHHGSRAQLQDDSARPPACGCRKAGDSPDIDGMGGLHGTLPVALVWGYRLGLPCGARGFEPTPRCAAQPGVGQHAPNATAAAPSPLLRQQMRDTTRPIGTTPLRTIALHVVLSLLLGSRRGTGRALQPLVITAARAPWPLTHVTHAKLGVLLVYPGVLPGCCCAQYAAAFLKMSHSSFTRVFAFRRRLSSS